MVAAFTSTEKGARVSLLAMLLSLPTVAMDSGDDAFISGGGQSFTSVGAVDSGDDAFTSGGGQGGLTSSTGPPQPKVQLKPLHWDKVNANVGHPTAWDKMDNGSFRFDGDLMEAMFGTVAANKKSPRHDNSPSPTTKPKPGPPSKIFILDLRRSQNIAIILRSLNVSRQEIIDCLLEGKGLDLETLEKLTKINPTIEEQQQILNYDQDTSKLADAESFLYHILKPVPSAFTRFNATEFLDLTISLPQLREVNEKS